MNNTMFDKNLRKSKEIEALFKTHPKYPFIHSNTNWDEYALASLFWYYIVKPYVIEYGNAEWKQKYVYRPTFRYERDSGTGDVINFYDVFTKRSFGLAHSDVYDDKFSLDFFGVMTYENDFLTEDSSDIENLLFELAIGVDLRQPEALDKAREFMHAFFIEKLPLEEMEKKIALFDETEGKKFKRTK